MTYHRAVVLRLAIAAAAMAFPVAAQQSAAARGTQQQHMQRHMTEMQTMMRQMSDMAVRSQKMHDARKPMMAKMSTADTVMPHMADHMSGMTTQMKGFMEQMMPMMMDPQMMKSFSV